jgi:hypothetical protein
VTAAASQPLLLRKGEMARGDASAGFLGPLSGLILRKAGSEELRRGS